MTEPSALAAALAAFQSEMPTVAKTKTATVTMKSGGQYSYTYADLADVSEAAMPLLAKNGLAFTALPETGERGMLLRGVLLHMSGERLEGVLPISGNTPQEMGSSLTYMRRYLFGCLTGIVTDKDDDGQLSQNVARKPTVARRPTRPTDGGLPPEPPPPPAVTNRASTPKQIEAIVAMMGKLGMKDRAVRLEYCARISGRPLTSSKDLTASEASRVIDALKSDLDDKPAADYDPTVEPGFGAS